MLIYDKFCKNCGAKYWWQASGDYQLDSPKEYNDEEYCPECKKVIIEALAKISKKTELRYVECRDYNMKQITEFETIENKKYSSPDSFPRVRRVFVYLHNMENPDDAINFERINEIKVNDINYRYLYDTRDKRLVKLMKEVRWDLIKDKILG